MANQKFLKKVEAGNYHINKNAEPQEPEFDFSALIEDDGERAEGSFVPIPEDEPGEEESTSAYRESAPIFCRETPAARPLSAVEENIIRFTCGKVLDSLFKDFKSEIYTEKFVGRLTEQYKEGRLRADDPHLCTLIHECVEREVCAEFLGDAEMTREVLLYIIGEESR